MESAFWDRVVADGHKVPGDLPLADLTAELVTMLGDVDPHQRDEIAYPTLATWVSEGVYDELLQGLGDGMAAGLAVGVGEVDTDTVFRRSFSALVLAECLERDAVLPDGGVPTDTVLRWGDQVATWLLRERDLRGFVPGKGWAHAVAHAADALGRLACHPGVGRLELTVLLDVVADRLLLPTSARFTHGEDDRLAACALEILRRDQLPLDVVEPWVERLAAHEPTGSATDDPFEVTGNVQAFLRALHLQLALAPRPPACRADLLLVLIGALKRTNPSYLG